MSDDRNTIARLRAEIEQLEAQLPLLADMPQSVMTLRQGIAERERRIAALERGDATSLGARTTVHGSVTRSVMSGSFAGMVT
jgi:uncharacterized small protein (DUF1192 family)